MMKEKPAMATASPATLIVEYSFFLRRLRTAMRR